MRACQPTAAASCRANATPAPTLPCTPQPPRSQTLPMQVEAFPLAGMFGLCVAFMVVSLVSQVQLDRLSTGKQFYHKVSSDGGEHSGKSTSEAAAS